MRSTPKRAARSRQSTSTSASTRSTSTCAAPDRGRWRWATSGCISGHYFQDWLLYDTDWNWRLEPEAGGKLRAVGDIGSHWTDLTSFISGLKVAEVMADMATFIPVRQQPAGPVETFSTRACRQHDPARNPDRGHGHRPDALHERRARRLRRVAARPPGARTTCSTRSMARRAPRRGSRRTRTSCGSATATSPTRSSLRNPALMNAAGRAAAQLPGGHVEGFADTHAAHFRAVYADVLARPHERAAALRHVRATATRRCSSATPSPTARAPAAGCSGRQASPLHKHKGLPCETRLPDRAICPDTPLMDVADWAAANDFDIARDRLLAANRRHRAALRRHEPYRRGQPVAGGGQRHRRPDRGQGAEDLGPRLLSQPAARRPGRARPGDRSHQEGHRGVPARWACRT